MSVFSFTSPLHRGSQVPVPILDGTALLRPLEPGETQPLEAVFGAMSLASRYDRYLQGISTLTPGMTRMLTAVDGTHHVAWLATVDGHAAGIGRYVKVSSTGAEIAFEVVDEFHGRGLGAALLDTLTTVAAAAGVRTLQATVLGSNRRSRSLLDQVGLQLQRQGGGVLEADGPFHLMARPRVERPVVLRLARIAWPVAA